MANTAMSDNMTIGLEQIVVTFTLMIVSLYVLSRHKLSSRSSTRSGDNNNMFMDRDRNKSLIRFNVREIGSWITSHFLGLIHYYFQKKKEDDDDTVTVNMSNNVRFKSTRNNNHNYDNHESNNEKRKASDMMMHRHRHNNYNNIHNSPMRKIQSSPLVSSIPSSIITTRIRTSSSSTKTISSPTTSTAIEGIPQSTNNYHTDDQQLQLNHHHPQHHGNNYDDYDYHNTSFTSTTNTNTTTNATTNTVVDNTDYYDESSTKLTDHERFTKTYESHLRYSDYRRLILPPSCRLLDAKTTAGINKKNNTNNHRNANNTNTNGENDTLSSSTSSNFFRIISWCIDITHTIVSFDYIGCMFIFNYRIIQALICRYKRVLAAWGFNIKIMDDEEEDDDDITVGSFGSRRSLLSKDSNHGVVSGTTLMSPKHSIDCRVVSSSQSTTADTTLLTTPTALSHNTEGGTLQSTASIDGDKNPRERFYTGEIFSSAQMKTKVGREDLLSLSKFDSNRSLEIPCNDSVASLSGFAESWELGPQSSNMIDSGMLIPPTNELLKEVEEKKDGVSLDDSSDHSQAELIMSMSLNDVGNPLSLPDPDLDILLSPASLDNPPNLERLVKKPTKNKAPSLTPRGVSGTRLATLSRPGSKRKDHLEVWRNPAASISSFISSTTHRNSMNVDRECDSPTNKDHSTELSYFDTAANKATIQKLERETALPDMQGYILGDQLLEDAKDTPLLIFVNSRSGSQQGLMLKMQLRTLMNPIQVWDLADGGPEKILQSFMILSRLRILVCGGDGTVSWIISALDKMKVERWPPIAILPLGTGNDLARIHGWGGGYANESLLLILKQVQEAYISLLDRWRVTIERKKKNKKTDKDDGLKKPFTNYMSIGMDALSALQVHNLRENSPDMFFSRAINKLWYGLYGAEDALKASCSDLPQQITLEADGVKIPIPEDCRGLIILNIDSYLGGVPLWSRGISLHNLQKRSPIRPPKLDRRYSDGDSLESFIDFENNMKRTNSFDSIVGDDVESYDARLQRLLACDAPSSCQDGRLDVITIRGNFHLGQIRVGLANAQKLCQCSRLKIELKKSIAMQLDGEPWKQDKSVLTIEREKEPAIMLHRAAEGGGGMEAEVADLLDWAEDNNVIKRDVHAIVMKEFSRRIESKTRARRDRSENNVFSAMKKTIARSQIGLSQIN